MSTLTDNPLFDYIIDSVDSPKWNPSSRYLDCKCPYCDADTSKKHGHFHIYLNDGFPLYYNCFRASCGVKGVLNRKVALDLGLDNMSFLKIIQKSYNSNITKESTKNFRYKGMSNIDLGTLDEITCEYFRKRTGVALTHELQMKFRICGSANEFIKNNIDQPKLDVDAMKFLCYLENAYSLKFIYFFNDNYTMLYARQINGDDKYKISIIKTNNPLMVHSSYMFKGEGTSKYNNSEAEDTLFLGEGVFDIINAYLHIYKDYSGIFMASTSFTSTVNCIDRVSKLVYRPDIVILSDSDVQMPIYTRSIMRRINKRRISDVYVVYNLEDKDLGDYKNKPFKIETTKIHERKR